MDISSKGSYPSNALSNFAAHPFTIDLCAWVRLLYGSEETHAFGVALENHHADNTVPEMIEVSSMEGFLQGLKFEKWQTQVEVFKLVGMAAKRRGSGRNAYWQQQQKLWFLGLPLKRDGKAYQWLLDLAYGALCKNESFKNALLATRDATLTHAIGHNKESETVLTRREFCSRLTRMRDQLQKKKK